MTMSAKDWVISAESAEKHGDTSLEFNGGSLRCNTPDVRWSYAISFKVPEDVRTSGRKLLISFAGEVHSGAVGFGAVNEDYSTYVAEEQFRPGYTDFSVVVPASKVPEIYYIVLRNTATSRGSDFSISNVRISTTDIPDEVSLSAITNKAFKPKADRDSPFQLASVLTTETCNLSCVMCHFNGPNAVKKSKQLAPSQVEKALSNLPVGETIWFAATGEFFIDENATSYLKQASSLGLKPCVLTHGQMFTPELIDQVLEAGVRTIRMSVDSTDENQYRKIRRGGELKNIIDACKYLRRAKLERYPDLRVEINATLFRNTFDRQIEMENFWRGLVDQVNFNAEYFDTFSFRNIFFLPERRVNCNIQLYLMPSGQIAPCCAIAVHQHDHKLDWLPHIDKVSSLQEAHEQLCDLYEDADGPMASICSKCDWWILSMSGKSPYVRSVPLDAGKNN